MRSPLFADIIRIVPSFLPVIHQQKPLPVTLEGGRVFQFLFKKKNRPQQDYTAVAGVSVGFFPFLIL